MQFDIIIGYASKTKLCGLSLGYKTARHEETQGWQAQASIQGSTWQTYVCEIQEGKAGHASQIQLAAVGDPLELLGVLHSTESGDGDSSPSSDDDETKDYRVESRKRKSTDRESDDDSGDDEEEIEEEEAPPVQYPP